MSSEQLPTNLQAKEDNQSITNTNSPSKGKLGGEASFSGLSDFNRSQSSAFGNAPQLFASSSLTPDNKKPFNPFAKINTIKPKFGEILAHIKPPPPYSFKKTTRPSAPINESPPPNPFAIKVTATQKSDIFGSTPSFSFNKTLKNSETGFINRLTPDRDFQPSSSAAALFSNTSAAITPSFVFGSSSSSSSSKKPAKIEKNIYSKSNIVKSDNVSLSTSSVKPIFTSTKNPFASDSVSSKNYSTQVPSLFKKTDSKTVASKIKYEAISSKRLSTSTNSLKSEQPLEDDTSSSLQGKTDQSSDGLSKKKVINRDDKTEKASIDELKNSTEAATLQVSQDEIQQITTIVLKSIPKELNNKVLLTEHFAQFGSVRHVKCSLKKEHALVYFKDHESAALAKKNGRKIHPDHPAVFVFWSGLGTKNTTPLKSPTSTASKTIFKVNAELEAMEAIEGNDLNKSKPSTRTRKRLLQETPVNLQPIRKTPLRRERKTSEKRKSQENTVRDKSISQERLSNREKQSQERSSNREKQSQEKVMTDKKKTEIEDTLTPLLDSIAQHNGDRYRILDARDKLMRTKLTKQSDLATAIAAVGTCPDMCPEKERYSRADQNALSFFEMKPNLEQGSSLNVMDPKVVLKEYSRSSADQEEPLSHELRPIKTLSLTMNHILCNVMDHEYSQGESQTIGEWFDFIWNRTRAIRKDITQQHLCDLETVSLVEKCARFHIHCSAILAEEDVMIFDPKINNENLTKCLQTLKHFYPDLEEKGVYCPNEAEFRAYEILLNLNVSDIASQAQNFRKNIRESNEVNFATKVFQTLSSNNYVRFFRMARTTTSYLNSCLMHRYFTQVRTQAVKAMLKAYRKPNHTENFSTLELSRLLAFESLAETEQFCDWLELPIEGENVLLNRAILGQPSAAAPICRARLLIESKRNCSVGEVINGGPLPQNPYPYYIPHNSFDEQSKLKKEAFDARDQSFKDSSVDVTDRAVSNSTPFNMSAELSKSEPNNFSSPWTLQSKPLFGVISANSPSSISDGLNLFLKSQLSAPSGLNIALNTFAPNPVIVRQPESIQPPVLLTVEEINELAIDNLNIVLDETVNNLALDISKSIFEELSIHDAATKLLLEVTGNMSCIISVETLKECLEVKDLKEKLELEHKIAEQLADELIIEISDLELYEISRCLYDEFFDIWLTEVSMDITEDLVDEDVREQTLDTAKMIYKQELNWKKSVSEFMDKKSLQRAKKFFVIWHDLCIRRKTFEFIRNTFPSGPPLKNTLNKIKLQNSVAKSFLDYQEEELYSSKLINGTLYSKIIGDEIKWHPLNLTSIANHSLLDNNKAEANVVTWKLALLPLVREDSQSILSWLSSKFDCRKANEEETKLGIKARTINIHNSKVAMSTILFDSENLNISKLKNSQELKGLSSVLLFLDNSNSITTKDRDLLIDFLYCKPLKPTVSISVLVLNEQDTFNNDTESYIASSNGLNLNNLISEGVISSYIVTSLTHQPSQNNKLLMNSLEYLAQNTSNIKIKTNFLQDLLEDTLRKLVFDPVFADLADKKSYNGTLHIQSPDAIASLYNAAIVHIASIVGNPALSDVSWPAHELSTLSKEHCVRWNHPKTLSDLYKSILKLKLPNSCLGQWDSLRKRSVWEFLESAIGKPNLIARSKVNSLLEKVPRGFIPWGELFIIITQQILGTFKMTEQDGESEIIVHYFDLKLDEFVQPQNWALSQMNSSCQLVDSPEKIDARKKRKSLSPPKSVAPIKIRSISIYEPEEFDEVLNLSFKLQKALQREAKESKVFAQKLGMLSEDDSSYIEAENLFCTGDSCEPRYFKKDQKSHKEKINSNSNDLEESLIEFKSFLESEKESNKIFEERLKHLIE